MFTYETVVRLPHTDAAGRIFYGRLFDLIHLAYEALLDNLDHPLPTEMEASPVVIPIVHASADYRSALRLNDRIRIEVTVEVVSERSFTLGYRVRLGERLAVEARTVHVAVARSSGEATRLPERLARRLRARTGDGDGS